MASRAGNLECAKRGQELRQNDTRLLERKMDLKKRIAEIAYKHKLSHLGSYFSSLEIIEEIYKEKSEDDIFILSSGHAALALYVVMEKYEGTNAEEMFLKHGGHPHRDEQNKIYEKELCSI